jgi:uncharacterized protein YjiK
VLILNVSACNPLHNGNTGKLSGYNFNKIDSKLILPDILLEISGATEIDNTSIACIQDENGILFVYDFEKNEIVKQYTFNIDGDYEGITRVDNTIYVLRSDGALIEIQNYNRTNFSVSTYLTGIPADNNEGLCYDFSQNKLLIACKGKLGKGPEFKDKRVIYSLDLTTKRLSYEPVYEFDVESIKQFAIKQNIKLPVREKKKKGRDEPILKFRTSAIAIHPKTKELYVLSAADYLIMVFDKNGEITQIEKLDETKFNKAEGITFLKNGDMLITNEGQQNKPTLLRFNYKV